MGEYVVAASCRLLHLRLCTLQQTLHYTRNHIELNNLNHVL
jgi:hypothetical protein